jgi:hypothetical protein
VAKIRRHIRATRSITAGLAAMGQVFAMLNIVL